MNVFERLHSGEAIDIRDEDYQREAHGEMDRCRQLCFEINSTAPKDKEKIMELENELLYGQIKDGTFFTPPFQVDLANCVKLGKNAWIGARVNILPGVTIGENAIIGTGSIVTKDIPDNAVAVGNPAKVVKMIEKKEDA